MEIKKYFENLHPFLFSAGIIYLFFIFYGYFFAQNSPPQQLQLILDQLESFTSPIKNLPSFSQFLFILLNNSVTLFFTLILGVGFGIFPFLVLLFNGMILGILFYISKVSLFFCGILPHGVFEIPALIIGSGVGLKLGNATFERIFKKKGNLKEEIEIALRVYLKILFPLLVIAGLVEVFITGKIILN